MKKFILVLLFVVFLIDLKAQTKVATESKETKAINKKIDQAIRHWKQNPTSDFPDIEAIIQNEITASLKARTEIRRVSQETKNINKKIDQAMQYWKQNPMTDFPDIKAIIQNEIMTSINQKTGIIDLDDMVKNRK